MSSEPTALTKHCTWDLVEPPINCNTVSCKWVFEMKRKSDSSVHRFKARLAKGYNQRLGLDYKETSSPIVKAIGTVLSIAIVNGRELRQMDVNNTFWHITLFETVYMQQPPGYNYLSKTHFFYRLWKAIYGLKQAPRAWYNALKKIHLLILILKFTRWSRFWKFKSLLIPIYL